MSPIRAVWFDVGEVLINETREYGTWADWLGIPRHTFSAMFGAVIARGKDYRQVIEYFHPGFDLDAERQARLDAGLGEYLNGHDLYPDVRPCLHTLIEAGYFVGIAGNQTTRAGRFLRELNLPCDILATSDDWGVIKPDVAFFSKLITVSGHQPKEIAYVGDRLDNDLRPAATASLRTVFVKRGRGDTSPTRTVFRDTPSTRAIALTGNPADRCNLRISAQSSTDNTASIPPLLDGASQDHRREGQNSDITPGSVFTCRQQRSRSVWVCIRELGSLSPQAFFMSRSRAGWT